MRSLHTPVGTAGLGASTVVQVTVWTLVSAVRTVRTAVTDTVVRDTDVSGVLVGTSPVTLRAGRLGGVTGVLFQQLVAPVTSVVLSVADVRLEDALVVVTLEVSLLAPDGPAGVGLVALILAVRSSITVPAFGHANAALLALELRVLVALVGSEDGTALLVTAVVTVRNAVTLVALVYTLLQVGTFELGGGAGDWRTAGLVRVVEAVIVTVTVPGLGDTVAGTLACELDVAAGLVLAGVVLVRVVSTVIFSVALPGHRNTSAVTALELRGLAGHIGTAGLVYNIGQS